MIEFNSGSDFETFIGWFRNNLLFPRATIMSMAIDDESGSLDDIPRYTINFQNYFTVQFIMRPYLEDVCRAHNDDVAAERLRQVFCDMLAPVSELYTVDGDDPSEHHRKLADAFVTIFSNR